MDTESQQRILGYFIEEANEHLVTLEQGILELASVVDDTERVNEMFRAAHSVKGGAAMLGYSSIQKIAHRLEDAFKVLQESNIVVDQKLETLFFDGYDVLQGLIERLQSPMGLQEEEATEIAHKAEPTFTELQKYLNQSPGGGAKAPAQEISPSRASAPAPNFTHQVKEILKQMLMLFKQDSTPDTRQQLQNYCDRLAELAPTEEGWHILLSQARNAIANPKHSYRVLAPVIITEIKQGGDRVDSGQGGQIAPSESLNQLATAKLPQIMITLEPEAAAETLKKAFDKQQLSQIVQLIQ